MRKYARTIAGRKRSLLYNAKKRAEIKNVPFGLTADDIEIPEFCPILGMKLVVGDGLGSRGPRPDSATLDRIDLTKGYVPGNIQVISARANAMKNDANPDELRKFATWIIKKYPEG
jgi:hypothetical protein